MLLNYLNQNIKNFLFFFQRDHANKTLTSLNSKLSVIETHRQSLDKQRTDLEGKRSAEKKRMEQVKALQQQIASMEQELEDLAAKGESLLSCKIKIEYLLKFSNCFRARKYGGAEGCGAKNESK